MQDSPGLNAPLGKLRIIDGFTRFLLVTLLFLCPIFFIPVTLDPFRPAKELLVNWVGLTLLLLQSVQWILTSERLLPDLRKEGILSRALKNPLPLLTVLLLLWMAFSALASPLPWLSLRTFLNNLALAGVFWACCRIVDLRIARAAGMALILASMANGLWAFLQFGGQDPYFTTASGQAIVGHRVHISAFTGNPNFLAPLFVFGTILAAALYMVSKSLAARICWTIVAVFLLLALAITQTISALASLLAVFVAAILGYFAKRGFKVWIIAAAAAVVALLAAAWILFMGFYTGELDNRAMVRKQALQSAKLDYLLNGRYYASLVTWEMISDHPFRGYGAGLFPRFEFQYETYYPQLDYYEFVKQEGKFNEAHNDYLQFWAENGLIGFVLLMAPVVWITIKLRRALFSGSGRLGINSDYAGNLWSAKDPRREQDSLLAGWALVGLAGAVNALANFPMHLPHLALPLVIAAAICARLSGAWIPSPDRSLVTGTSKRAIRSLIALLLTAALGICGWWLFLPYRGAMIRRVLQPQVERISELRKAGEWDKPKTANLAKQLQEQAELLVKMDPWTSDNHVILALAFFYSHQFSKAEKSYQQVVALRTDATMHANMGATYAEMGDPVGAKVNYGIALLQNPFQTQAQDSLKMLGEFLSGRKYPPVMTVRQVPLLIK
jgi:O-antigen ligase